MITRTRMMTTMTTRRISGRAGDNRNPRADGPESSSGTRKIGQILVDLGFIDESQLWDLLEEARTNGLRVGHVAVTRGLVTEEQVLQAIAEQHHLRVVNFEDEKPTPQAIGMVQQAMAE